MGLRCWSRLLCRGNSIKVALYGIKGALEGVDLRLGGHGGLLVRLDGGNVGLDCLDGLIHSVDGGHESGFERMEELGERVPNDVVKVGFNLTEAFENILHPVQFREELRFAPEKS